MINHGNTTESFGKNEATYRPLFAFNVAYQIDAQEAFQNCQESWRNFSSIGYFGNATGVHCKILPGLSLNHGHMINDALTEEIDGDQNLSINLPSQFQFKAFTRWAADLPDFDQYQDKIKDFF